MSIPIDKLQEDGLKRKILFDPCTTKEDLHRWIKVFLKIDFPDCIVDADSTSSPMDSIWTVYNAIRTKNTEEMSQVLTYASRASFKTLGASVIEVLAVVHLCWNVCHMAAILEQSKVAQKYVKKAFQMPFLRDFVVAHNATSISFARYKHISTDEIISPIQWAALKPAAQEQFEEVRNTIEIVICTMQGANSKHAELLVIDEVDVVSDPDAYEEAKMIPDAQGMSPVTLYTSTRKFSVGLVQKEIDRSHETGLKIMHWNILDVTRACPASRHLPNEPKIPIYRSDEKLHAVSEEEWRGLPEKDQILYVKDEGFKGCLTNCRLFGMCKGRLATHQKSTSTMLKDIGAVTNLFKALPPDKAKSQLLCWLPSSEALIYPNFDREKHMLTAAEMAERITGDKYPANFTKAKLIEIMKERQMPFFSGLDHGFNHDFAIVTAGKDGSISYIVDVVSVPGLELPDKLELMESRLRDIDPVIFPDSADPSSNATMKRFFKIRPLKKGKDSVIGGIENVRMMISPTMGQAPLMYLLKGDEGCEFLASRIQRYHWMLDAAGNVLDVPSKDEDDVLDALRYLIVSAFKMSGIPNEKGSANDSAVPMWSDDAGPIDTPTSGNYLPYFIQKALGNDSYVDENQQDDSIPTIDLSKGWVPSGKR